MGKYIVKYSSMGHEGKLFYRGDTVELNADSDRTKGLLARGVVTEAGGTKKSQPVEEEKAESNGPSYELEDEKPQPAKRSRSKE